MESVVNFQSRDYGDHGLSLCWNCILSFALSLPSYVVVHLGKSLQVIHSENNKSISIQHQARNGDSSVLVISDRRNHDHCPLMRPTSGRTAFFLPSFYSNLVFIHKQSRCIIS